MVEKLSSQELQDIWEQDRDGEYIQINDRGVFFMSHGCNRDTISRESDFDDIMVDVLDWCEQEQFFPNIWEVNDHGNVSLYDLEGSCLGGLV